jgi:hypothetical protein
MKELFAVFFMLVVLTTGCLSFKDDNSPFVKDPFKKLEEARATIMQSKLIGCYRCENGSWPGTFQDIVDYRPSSERCLTIRANIYSKYWPTMYESFPYVKVKADFWSDKNKIKGVDTNQPHIFSYYEVGEELSVFGVLLPQSLKDVCT